ncbi:MAG TPA: permease prefix domain 1-containing protein, partial [Chthoniobacterales bacterium]|nr:permease prefix domain 1-containing protein [Chthoniobacterales bacterium]
MPDFKSEIRRSIAGLNLSPTREEEIVEELSQDLEERFEQALDRGVSEEEATRLVLEELTRPDSLSEELRRIEKPRRRASGT